MCGEHESILGGPIGGSGDQTWSLGGPPRAPKGAFRAKMGPFMTPGGPEEARYQVKVCGDHESNPGGLIGSSRDQICSPGAPRGPPRAPKGAFRAETGPFRTPGGPEGARYQVKVCGDHESNPDGPMGGSRDQIWPLGALRGPPGPPKGPFGSEMSPFGGPRSAVEVR